LLSANGRSFDSHILRLHEQTGGSLVQSHEFMLHDLPVLACGDMGLTKTDGILILSIIAGWLVAAVLFIANLVLIFQVRKRASFGVIHGTIVAVYVGLAIFLFNFQKIITINPKAAINPKVVMIVGSGLTVAIPLLVITHFIYLLIYRRRFKREIETAATPAHVNPSAEMQ